ncbi:MAG: two-component regulator propeller domain-containing protein [Bacteroidales bacterium]|nr:two-component regulator propeller domain-containing protein [Bacteroidales bacterium]MDD3167369.1 two-component regulator propeller domain-containing protein [Bacteroidales bacterium]MDD4770029.1 two-component regulator propeller domain-containing protein [Bacteroidales bacterium]
MKTQPYLRIGIALLWCLQTENAWTQDYASFDNLEQATQNLCIRSIDQTEDGMLWLGTENGLFSYDGYHLIQRTESFQNSYNSLLIDGDSILIGSNSGISSFKRNKLELKPLTYAINEPINDIARIRGTLWVATETGLYINGKKMPANIDGITSLAYDEAYVYIGTRNAVFRYSHTKKQFEKIVKNSTYVTSLLTMPQDSTLWIGTASHLIAWNQATDKITHHIPMPVVKALQSDPTGNLLIGTDNGLYLLDSMLQISHITHDARRTNSLAGNAVWSFFRDQDQNLWIGTNSGLSLAHNNPILKIHDLPSLTGEGRGNQFFCVYTDQKKRLWMGGSDGILCIERFGSKRQEYRWYQMNDAHFPLPHNRLRCIIEDSKGNILIGGDMGLMIHNEKTRQFEPIYIQEDPNNWVYNIREINDNQLQIATYTATYTIEPHFETHTATVIGTQLKETQAAENNNGKRLLKQYGLTDSFLSAYSEPGTGLVLLGGTDRFALLDTRQWKVRNALHPWQITDIRIHPNRYVNHNDIKLGKIVFEPQDAWIEILLSDFSYSGISSTGQRYQLNGATEMPIPSTTQSIRLSNIRSGTHTLTLLSENTKQNRPCLKLVIKAPWYKSTLAKLAYLLTCLALSLGIYRYLQQKKKLKQERASHRTLLHEKECLSNQLRIRMQAQSDEENILSDDEKFVLRITKLIEARISDPNLNVQMLSKLSGVTEKQLYRKIKATTGMSTVTYIRDLRLKKAALLLSKGRFSVAEVMYRVGFSNSGYFTRCFSEAYNIPPSEYPAAHPKGE